MNEDQKTLKTKDEEEEEEEEEEKKNWRLKKSLQSQSDPFRSHPILSPTDSGDSVIWIAQSCSTYRGPFCLNPIGRFLFFIFIFRGSFDFILVLKSENFVVYVYWVVNFFLGINLCFFFLGFLGAYFNFGEFFGDCFFGVEIIIWIWQKSENSEDFMRNFRNLILGFYFRK